MWALGFGGLLIGRALFSDEPHDQFQNRFRHAREIFLVFAGIFGTIIGFYFGASDDDAAAAQGVPAIEVATAANRTVEVTVTNGAEPFMGMLELADGAGAAALTADGRKLTTQLGPDQCPSGAKIRIVDGRGRRAEAEIAEKPDALNKQGWKCPPDGTEPDNATAPADNPSNATNEALPTNEEAAQDPVT